MNILVIIVSSLVLIKAVKLFVTSTIQLAHVLRISAYTVSFLLVSLGTSLPELFVSITSGIEKNTVLAYGNALGSNVALITLIISLPVLIGRPVSTREVIRSRDIYYSAIFLLLSLGLGLDRVLTRFDGLFLIVCYLFYVQLTVKKASLFESIKMRFETVNALKQLGIFLLSLILLLIASEGIVRSAVEISASLAISMSYIGLTLVAIGTSLPEIAYGLGIINGHKDHGEMMGDIIGSIVANASLILGVAAVLHPIDLRGSKIGFPTTLFLVSTLLLFLVFSKTDYKINKKEAWVLLTTYILFLAAEYILVS